MMSSEIHVLFGLGGALHTVHYRVIHSDFGADIVHLTEQRLKASPTFHSV